jgi:hypothetical protein
VIDRNARVAAAEAGLAPAAVEQMEPAFEHAEQKAAAELVA